MFIFNKLCLLNIECLSALLTFLLTFCQTENFLVFTSRKSEIYVLSWG